jgi:hypothetical protein
MRPEGFAERLRELMDPKWVRPAATIAEISSAEARLGVVLPEDLRSFYRCVGGTDEATPLENGWITFWPLDRWESAVGVENEFGHGLTLIADHGLSSWFYAAEFPARANTPIFIVDGLRKPRLIAPSFAAFIDAAIRNDARIYPEPLGQNVG